MSVYVTDGMVAAFKAAEIPEGWTGDQLLRARLEAMFRHMREAPGVVLLTRQVFDQMEKDQKTLQALEDMGVDNWGGYEDAMAALRQAKEAAEDEEGMFRV
jgi:hypothetical protein